MEEMISKVSAGIEKAKADIISVIDENHVGQPSQSNRLEINFYIILIINNYLLQIPSGLLVQPVSSPAERGNLCPGPALETVQSLHSLDRLQSGRDQSEPGGPPGRPPGPGSGTAGAVLPHHRPGPRGRPGDIASRHPGQCHRLCQQTSPQINTRGARI